MTTEQRNLQGALLKRGRKTFWVCGVSGNQVQVYSTNGAYKSFSMSVADALPLVQRAACGFDMDPEHRGSAHKMAGTFAAMGQRDALDTALAVLDRWS